MKQTIKNIVSTISGYPIENMDSIIQNSMKGENAIATLASVFTAGAYDNKKTIPALRLKFKAYCAYLEQGIAADFPDGKGTETGKQQLAMAIAKIKHFQKAINRQLAIAGKKRNLQKADYLHLSHGKLANSKTHLLGTKAITVQVKAPATPATPAPESASNASTTIAPTSGNVSGDATVSGQVRTEQQQADMQRGEQLAAVTTLIQEASALGDTQLLSTIATQALTALENIQTGKKVKQTATNKRAFTTALKLMTSYRAQA